MRWQEEEQKAIELQIELQVREERAYRMWYTSLGHAVESGSFLEDCRTGLPLLRTMATLQPGLVDWVRSP